MLIESQRILPQFDVGTLFVRKSLILYYRIQMNVCSITNKQVFLMN